jgi:hypothetical protein
MRLDWAWWYKQKNQCVWIGRGGKNRNRALARSETSCVTIHCTDRLALYKLHYLKYL